MKYYVYALIDPRTGLPFYIGKGKNSRWRDHLTNRAKGENPEKDSKIIDIRNAGFEPTVAFLHKDLTEKTAYDLEAQEIERFGRKCIREDGILLNLSAGGKGRISAPCSAQTREKISKAGKGQPKSQPMRDALSKSLKGKPKSPEFAKRMSELHSGKIISDDHKKAISAKLKGREITDEHRAKIAAAVKAYWENKRKGN